MAPSREGLLDNKTLEFSLDILNVQFNYLGRYFVKLSLQSSHTHDYSGIHFRKNDSGLFISEHVATTDVIHQEEQNKFYQCQTHKFTFVLPKGFCKNDASHDVYLLVEAFELRKDPAQPGRRVGESKFAIYPRTNAPKVNTTAPIGKDMYQTSDVLTLLRTSSTENINMHCGRINFSARFREIENPWRQRTPSPSPPPEPIKSPPLSKVSKASNKVPPKTKSLEQNASLPRVKSPIPRRKSPVASPKKRSPPPKIKRPVAMEISFSEAKSSDPRETKVEPSIKHQPRLELPVTPPWPDELKVNKVQDLPMPRADEPSTSQRAGKSQVLVRYVARPGYEEVVVILHGASNLPPRADGATPVPYCIVKTKSAEDRGWKAAGVTNAAIRPTHSPAWEEQFTVHLTEKAARDEVLVLSVADQETQEEVVNYRLPISFLWPFHQYHLEMVMPMKSTSNGIRLFMTITRKTASLPRDYASPNYVGMEVMLQGIQQELRNPVGPLTAVARMVPDYSNYKTKTLMSLPHTAGIDLMSVSFPSPHLSAFNVPSHTRSQGFPQITLPGHPQEQPEWDHTFFFSHHRDKATLFTPGAALVLEFFQASSALTDVSWHLHKPLGYATLLLDPNVYRQLTADGGRAGVCVDKLPLQATTLETKDGKIPTVGLILRLINSERPDSLVSVGDASMLPKLDLLGLDTRSHLRDTILSSFAADVLTLEESSTGRRERVTQDRKLEPVTRDVSLDIDPFDAASPQPYWMMSRKIKPPASPLKDGEMPSHDAMESILPEYQYIFTDPDPHQRPAGQSQQPTQLPLQIPDDLDRGSLSLLDYQMRELEKYRTALHKMGQDILTLRQRVRELESENSRLRLDLSHHTDATRLIMDSAELDGLTKPELAARYATVKQKLASQTTDLKAYKERVTTLQNQLIKKNDSEKDYLAVQAAHHSQQDILQKLQDKASKVRHLEDACRKQEKVIEKMERLLNKANFSKDSYNTAANDALVEENKRLRTELEDLKDRERSRSSQRDKVEEEQLGMYEQLDRAQSRIASLEKQLAENARTWAREKSDLMLRLGEAEHGLNRNSPNLQENGFMYKTYPKITARSIDPEEFSSPRRYSRAPQLQKSKKSTEHRLNNSYKHKHHRTSPKLEPLYF